ncbi:HNH endonuclease [Rossellomorea vietnamensis]|uniref:HNH endonuclease n=1 Tax=Rossellomorea vietnamensis TaxID=218284 RepID=UPI00077C92CB|nr:HNH endonuclease [Rossellomorea vietnamensis]
MVIFRGLAKTTNVLVGGAAKTGVTLISKAVSSKHENAGKYVGDLGFSIINASKRTLESGGQFTDGAIRAGYGLVKKDEHSKQQGWHDIKDSTGRTVKGIGSSIKYTVKSTGMAYSGFRSHNKEQMMEGFKNLGKVAAVTTFAVGIVDLVDGVDIAEADGIETRNDHLNGFEHADTHVPFEAKVIELPNGEVVEGTFPVFESDFSVVLAEDAYLADDYTHFRIANDTLYQSILQDPSLVDKLGLNANDVEALSYNETPEGYVWHHSEEPGVLQLVNEDVHQDTGHTGGRTLWGGGSEYR